MMLAMRFCGYKGVGNMIVTKELLDELTAEAKVNPSLRMAMDLRYSAEDGSQRMLIALEPGTVIIIEGMQKYVKSIDLCN